MLGFAVAMTFLAAAAGPSGEVTKLDLPSANLESPALPPLDRSGFSLPIVNYAAPGGTLRRKRGIIAGVQVAPRTMVGIGFFETAKKRRASNDGITPEKRSKRAALGISFQF